MNFDALKLKAERTMSRYDTNVSSFFNSKDSNQTNSKDRQASYKINDYPIFNDEYYIISKLNDGRKSDVYLCESIQDPEEKKVLKIYKHTYLMA